MNGFNAARKTHRLQAGLVGMCLFCAACAAQAASQYDTPPTLKASQTLPAEIRKGEFHDVQEYIANDGMFNMYVISSKFGEFFAPGGIMLNVRLQEIQALGELDRIGKTDIFVKSAKEAGMSQIRSIQELSKTSSEFFESAKQEGYSATTKTVLANTQAYVGEKVDETKEQLRKVKKAATKENAKKQWNKIKEMVGKDDEKDAKADDKASATPAESDEERAAKRREMIARAKKAAAEYFGVTDAERAWAEKLHVDPYSSNVVLRKAIRQAAMIDRAGNFAVKFAPIPGIPGMKYVGKLNKIGKIIWSNTPESLSEINRRQLLATGATAETVEAFLNHPIYSPTLQTAFASALTDLEGVSGRDGALEEALGMETETQARLLIETVALLAWHHQTQTPAQSLLTTMRLPLAQTKQGGIVFLLPTDALFWTEEVAAAANGYASSCAEMKAASREFWTTGTASDRFKQGLAQLGWTVKERVRAEE